MLLRVGASSLPLILVKTLKFYKESSRVGNAYLLGEAGKEISHDLALEGTYIEKCNCDVLCPLVRVESRHRPAMTSATGCSRDTSTLAAVASAIEDALTPIGIRADTLPATPERALGWIDEAKARSS